MVYAFLKYEIEIRVSDVHFFACLFVVFRPTREFYTRMEMVTNAGEGLQRAGATNGKFDPVNLSKNVNSRVHMYSLSKKK